MLTIQPLKESLNNLDKDTLLSFLQDFVCEKDSDIERFLSDYSIQYEEKGVSRTFLVFDDKICGQILGYFSIGLNVMRFKGATKSVGNAYDGINLYQKNFKPVYKLFMIGKDDRYKRKVDMANIFNNFVMPYIYNSQKYIGCDLMYIDCVPELEEYYSKLGFKFLDKIKKYKMIRMIRKV